MEDPLHIRRDKLLAEIAGSHGFPRSELSGERRFRPLVRARQEWFYRAKSELGIAWSRIGFALEKSRADAMYGAARHAERHGLPHVTTYRITDAARISSINEDVKAPEKAAQEG